MMTATKRSPIETFAVSPKKMRTMLGGIMLPSEPPAQMVPIARFRS